MKRGLVLVGLLVAGVLATLWLRAPAPPPGPPTASCDQAETCSTVSAGSEEPAPAESRSRRPEKPPDATDPVQLREESDRLIADGKFAEGLEKLRAATHADPSLKNHADLGSWLYRLTAFDEAARHLRAAAEMDPGNADRWIALANAYYRKVDPGEAWKAEKRAREAEPGLVLGRDAEGMRVRKSDSGARQP